jgi:hypothetical protein
MRLTKWQEMQQMGKLRFVWRERALFIGVPVGIALAFFVGGWRPRSVVDLVSNGALVGIWVPLAVSMLAGAIVGHVEWDHERREAMDPPNGR